MAVTIEIEEQTADVLKAQADARGLSLDQFLRQMAGGIQESCVAPPGADAARDFDTALDELFAADPRQLPPLHATYSREDIYIDHD